MSRRAVFHRKAAGRDIFHFDLSGHEHLFQKPGENFGNCEPFHPLGGEDGDGVPHLAVQRDLHLSHGLALLHWGGQILGQEARPGAQQVDALVPLANMFGYATDLRSATQGRGQYTMEPHSYCELPKNLRDKIVSERTKPQD